MKTSKMKYLEYIVLMLFLVLFIASCTDESNPSTPQEEHFKATGLVVLNGSQRVLTYYNLKCSDTLFAPIGLTDHYQIKFLSSDSTVIEPPTDTEKVLGWTISDTSIADIYRHGGDIWEFHIKGKKIGVTDIEFKVLHIDHADFTTIKIPIVVHDLTGEHGDIFGVTVKLEETDSTLAEATILSDNQVNGNFNLSVGELTDHLEFEFFDEQNRYFSLNSEEYSISSTMDNAEIAEFVPVGAEEPWAFHLKGIAKGTTYITFKLIRNDEIVIEFAPIRVVIK